MLLHPLISIQIKTDKIKSQNAVCIVSIFQRNARIIEMLYCRPCSYANICCKMYHVIKSSENKTFFALITIMIMLRNFSASKCHMKDVTLLKQCI